MPIQQTLADALPASPALLLFSAGLDSCAVLGAALHNNRDITPVWVDNGFNRATYGEISRQAANMGADNLEVLELAPSAKVCENPGDRCFYCKSQFLKKLSLREKTLVDGTTASDLGAYRPGLKALKTYNVRSPLAEASVSKDEAGKLALQWGADPQLAGLESCLATRFKYEETITSDYLQAIRAVERYIIEQTGDYDVRCRIDGPEHMRIEVKKPETYYQFAREQFRKHIIEQANAVTLFVTMDLESSRPNAYDKYLKGK